MIHGRPARAVWGALWALKEEISAGNLVRVDPEYEWGQPVAQRRRKPNTFTLTFRLGESGNRVEKHVQGVLNAVLTAANRARGDGGPGILAWRAKTRGEKRKRAFQRAQAAGADGDGQGGGSGG